MHSQRRVEEDTTPECEELGNPPKKRKMDYLLLEAEKRNLDKLKDLVYHGADVIGEYPQFLVKKKAKKEDKDGLILPTDADIEQLIEDLELVGAACIFHEDIGAQNHGWTCWNEAMKLRFPGEGNAILKPTLYQSKLETLALRNKREFQNAEDLNELLGQRLTHWKTQAFFVSQRIFRKYDCFPNTSVVHNLYKFALKGWENRGLDRSRAFAISLYLIELFGTTKFLDQLVLNPTKTHNVLYLTFTELSTILQNRKWIKLTLTKPNTVLTFDHLMISLVFCCEYQMKVHDHCPNNGTKKNKQAEISNLILHILKLVVSIPKSKTQSKQLKSQLASYISNYEFKRAEQKSNLLLKVCAALPGQTDDFKLIKLLLKAGANTNAVDEQRYSPLHLLAKKELKLCRMWQFPSYSTRAQYFTAITRTILEGRFHEDQVNLFGESALDYFKSQPLQYPDPQFRKLLSDFTQNVRPLSCIAATIVQKHRLPFGSIPVTLQSLVGKH